MSISAEECPLCERAANRLANREENVIVSKYAVEGVIAYLWHDEIQDFSGALEEDHIFRHVAVLQSCLDGTDKSPEEYVAEEYPAEDCPDLPRQKTFRFMEDDDVAAAGAVDRVN